MTRRRSALVVAVLAIGVYLSALPNGFAYDDTGLILANPVVQGGDFSSVLSTPYWSQAAPGSGLFRPVTTSLFVLEWGTWGESALPYHALSVLLHVANSVFVLLLALSFTSLLGATLAGALFAVHPVHVEAVANIAGQSELLATFFLLAALLIHSGSLGERPARRAVALALIPALYLLGLGAKENAFLLPALCVLVSSAQARGVGDTVVEGAKRLAPLLFVLGAVAATYAVFRVGALGVFTGDAPAAELRGLSTAQRLMTAFALWPEFLRLMLFPVHLAADYGPAVFLPALALHPGVAAGVVLVAMLAAFWFRKRRSWPEVDLAIPWFVLTILPVSQLFFAAGTILAERTLYLPSVGFCILAGGLLARGHTLLRPRGLLLATAGTALLLLGVRAGVRNPSWASTYEVFRTLHRDHPESFLGQRARAAGLAAVGEEDAAAEAYLTAVALSPRHYATLAEAGEFLGRIKRFEEAEGLLRRAIKETPAQPLAYRLLSAHLLNQGKARSGHRVAAEGLAVAGEDPELWQNLAHAYSILGDTEAAVRARGRAIHFRPGIPGYPSL